MQHAGLVSSSYITVDDTGARHANRNFHTTHIGGEHFTAFRTAPSKSRLNFLAAAAWCRQHPSVSGRY
nr:hypothetical protein [Brucella pituitosa]